MTNILQEIFGNKVGDLLEQAINENQQVLTWMQNYNNIACYLEKRATPQEIEKILDFRARLDWFDCFILMLQNFSDLAAEHSDAARKTALYYLKLYGRPTTQQMKNSIAQWESLWGWVLSLQNDFIKGFLEEHHDGLKYAICRPSAASLYKLGTPYQEFSFSISLNTKLEMSWQISFFCAQPLPNMEERFWGQISISPNIPNSLIQDQEKFQAQQSEFLEMLLVDIYDDQSNPILQNIHCNHIGEFEIETKKKEIHAALDEKRLRCVVHLTKER